MVSLQALWVSFPLATKMLTIGLAMWISWGCTCKEVTLSTSGFPHFHSLLYIF